MSGRNSSKDKYHGTKTTNHSKLFNGLVIITLSLVFTGLISQRASKTVTEKDKASGILNFVGINTQQFFDNNGTSEGSWGIRDAVADVAADAKAAVMSLFSPSQKSEGLDGHEAVQMVKLLSSRATSALEWAGTLKKNVNSFDRIQNSEIHMLHKLAKFLTKAAAAEGKDATNLATLISKGYQCTSAERSQQEAIAKTIAMDICSEVEWYKIMHLAWPEASTFIDVGANKGYLGSLFISLWGGGGLGISPASLYQTTTKLKTWEGSRNPAGYCKDGLNYGLQLYCYGPLRDTNGICNESRPEVKVFSIDGSSHLVETMNGLLRTHYPPIARTHGDRAAGSEESGGIWSYYHYAASDKRGVTRFTKQGKGQKQSAGFEGGHISSAPSADTEEVKMISIDEFTQQNGIKHVDLLKIDAEGNDNKVLTGAAAAMNESIGVFTFEGGKGVSLTKGMLKMYDDLGFSCYSTSRAGLFKWNGGCMVEKFMGGFYAKDKGNIFCASRIRAPLVTLAMDVLSFPMMIREVLDVQPSIPDPAQASLRGAAANSSREISAAMMTKAYVNIKPFCTPWPSCAAKI